MPGPPIFLESNPLAESAASRIISASSLILDCLESKQFPGSAFRDCGLTFEDCVQVLLVTMSLCSFFMDQPESIKQLLIDSSRSGWLGNVPLVPKSSSVSTMPLPKQRIHVLLTVTLEVSGFFGSTSHLARSSRDLFPSFCSRSGVMAQIKLGLS